MRSGLLSAVQHRSVRQCLRPATQLHAGVNAAASLLLLVQIKNFQEGQDGQAAPSSAAAEAAAKAAAQQVIPHALAKLEKPEDEMYTVGGWVGSSGAGARGAQVLGTWARCCAAVSAIMGKAGCRVEQEACVGHGWSF